MLITMQEGQRLAGLLGNLIDSLRTVTTVAQIEASAKAVSLPQLTDANAIALIQYTSGSTGDPKGVVLSHANLLANIRALGTAMEASSADIFVSWLPLYHDMGLIGSWLGCLYYAARLYVMSPLSFLVRPQSWLWAMHRFRATYSASPNFGFELCLAKITDDDLKGLDLSSLRMVANGAEPVSVQTLRSFAERFARYGFSRTGDGAGLRTCRMFGRARLSAFRPPTPDRSRRSRPAQHAWGRRTCEIERSACD
jgi:acyl-CoA synthetase (AMP-forming)/AMP-acid ligase II